MAAIAEAGVVVGARLIGMPEINERMAQAGIAATAPARDKETLRLAAALDREARRGEWGVKNGPSVCRGVITPQVWARTFRGASSPAARMRRRVQIIDVIKPK